jgi:hypothetical protein
MKVLYVISWPQHIVSSFPTACMTLAVGPGMCWLQVEARPKLRREDVQRQPHHGPEVPLHKGSLQGPPSRQQDQAQAPPAPALAAEPSEASLHAQSMGGRSHNHHQGRRVGRAGLGSVAHAWGTHQHQQQVGLTLSPEALAASEAVLQGKPVGGLGPSRSQAPDQHTSEVSTTRNSGGTSAPVVYTRSSSLSAASPGHSTAWGLTQGRPSPQQQQQRVPPGAGRGGYPAGAAALGTSPPLLPDVNTHLRRPTALSDSASPGTQQQPRGRPYAGGSPAQSSGAQVLVVSHAGDQAGGGSGDRTPPRSVGSAASEPALMPGSGNGGLTSHYSGATSSLQSPPGGILPVGGAAGLRKSLSVGHQHHPHRPADTSRPVVLPQIGHASNNWVLSDSKSSTSLAHLPPTLAGKTLQGLSPIGKASSATVQQLHLPPRGR